MDLAQHDADTNGGLRVLVCCDRFKGSAEASQINQRVASTVLGLSGTRGVLAEVRQVTLTDGGAGFLDAVMHMQPVDNTPGDTIQLVAVAGVSGPLAAPLDPDPRYVYFAQRKHAFIEMASAAGIEHVPVEMRNPMRTTTFGVGQMIRHAIGQGAAEITVGLGGSATNDGGLGALVALGAVLSLSDGTCLRGSDPTAPMRVCGGVLEAVVDVDLEPVHRLLEHVRVRLMTDVSNPLTGPSGCAAVYGPQKGATSSMVDQLDRAMSRVGDILAARAPTHGFDPRLACGAGAAGGLGAGLLAGCPQVSLVRGAEVFADMCGLRDAIAWADVVVTGEGRFDDQTILYGKTVAMVVRMARESMLRRPRLIVMCGSCGVSEDQCSAFGVDDVVALTPRFAVEEAMAHALECLETVLRERAADVFAVGR